MKRAKSRRRPCARWSTSNLGSETLEPRLPLTAVASLTPLPNSNDAALTADLQVVFDQEIDSSSLSDDSVVVHTLRQGRWVEPQATAAVSTIDVTYPRSFLPGEQVSATVSGLEAADGTPIPARVWQFRAEVAGGGAAFEESDQSLGTSVSRDVSLGDLDNDGDLDAYVSNYGTPGRIWVNDAGVFSASEQELPGSSASALGDLDGDGDLDVFAANCCGGNRVLLNDGTGLVTDSGQSLGGRVTSAVSLGDLDGDGDLDAFVININSFGTAASEVWLNDGAGAFQNSGQTLGDGFSRDVALGDVDGDGDLDAYVANSFYADQLLVNDGSGNFTLSQYVGDSNGYGVSLGDLDGDGDLDVFVANGGGAGQANQIFLNDDGVLTDSGQQLGSHASVDIELGDLDGDGDLDGFVVNSRSQENRVWVNESGEFIDTRQKLAGGSSAAAELGDLDGDGDLDAFNANAVGGNSVWTNSELLPSVSFAVNTDEIAEASESVTATVTLSTPAVRQVTVELEIGGTVTESDYALSSEQIIIPVGGTTGQVTLTAIQDEIDEGDETIMLSIAGVTNAEAVDAEPATVILRDDDRLTFRVDALTANPTGFTAEFNQDLDLNGINLYSTQTDPLGPADVALQGDTVGPISGSLILGTRSARFIKSGGPLLPDTYQVTIRSGDDAVRTALGELLDGDGNGEGGDAFTASFSIDESPAGTVTISLPDFVRGPGQPVNLPADSDLGIPLMMSSAAGIRSVALTIAYNPALLQIDDVNGAAGLPAGASVAFDGTNDGQLQLTITSDTDLPSDIGTLVWVKASVPTVNAEVLHRERHTLDLVDVSVLDRNQQPLPTVADSGLHVVSYFGDVSSNGRINASDAARVARVAALLDSGFRDSELADPMLLGDISGNGRINAADASRLARVAALIPVPEVPDVPVGVLAASTSGAFPSAAPRWIDYAEDRGWPDHGRWQAATFEEHVDQAISEFDSRDSLAESLGTEDLLDACRIAC